MLPVLFPRDRRMRVSHETIYQSLFVQTKGELKRELTAHLRTQRQRRKPHTGGAKRATLGTTDDIRISARPAEAEDRAGPGHWEAISRSAARARSPGSWGTEMAQHAQFKTETGIQVYFCDPQSPWQRGTNETTNALLRQYWPKGADLRQLTTTECDHVALSLNT